MKKHIFILLALVAIMSGCKKQNWLDWKAMNEAWMEQNKIAHEGDTLFHVSETGLQYRVLYPGNTTDAKPGRSSTVLCTYKGRLINGTVFDSGTSELPVANVVAGFAEGLKQIHSQGDIEIFIPWQLGYVDSKGYSTGTGTEGTQSFIPPYSVLIFTVHINSIY